MTAPWHIDQQLCFAVYATSRALVRAYDPLLAPLGVTYPQYLVLLALWETDDLTVSGIGERLDLDSGTLTSLLKRLEARGLITRRRDDEDERVLRIALTKEGKSLRSEATRIWRDLGCALGMTATEAGALRETLHDVLRRLRTSAVAAEAPVASKAGVRKTTPRKKR